MWQHLWKSLQQVWSGKYSEIVQISERGFSGPGREMGEEGWGEEVETSGALANADVHIIELLQIVLKEYLLNIL